MIIYLRICQSAYITEEHTHEEGRIKIEIIV